ncbi:hypothetical protein [Aquimarina sp. I32.4]|uniref:hypothetical protein n=1 Tax=Aquimarina sp. I32.4 TaxID=2053903 RepID=UPI000CDF05D1|nr:hypothetical protein [Aquimarina sp. I32.4]
MNIKELSYLLQNPAQLDKEQTNSLEKIVRTFPYFQSARSLWLKSLKNQESFRYNQELKVTAAYTTDRSILFDFITSDLFDKNTDSQETEKKQNSEITVIEPEEIKALPRIAMDDAIRMKIKEAEDVLDPALFSVRKENSASKQIEIAASTNSITPEKKHILTTEDENEILKEGLQIDKPLDFNKKETHSFAEWLKLTSLTPVDRDTDQEVSSPAHETKEIESEKSLDQKDKFNLIDEFIINNPKIQPAAKNTPARNLAKENVVSTDELMTETLARVYLAQKNYKKAIQAYNILILKNPEKSGFFADQIRSIKKLQENK